MSTRLQDALDYSKKPSITRHRIQSAIDEEARQDPLKSLQIYAAQLDANKKRTLREEQRHVAEHNTTVGGKTKRRKTNRRRQNRRKTLRKTRTKRND
jgi:hypothetical protein